VGSVLIIATVTTITIGTDTNTRRPDGAPAIAANVVLSGEGGTVCRDGVSDTVVENLLPHPPRSISVRIPGGQGGGIVFEGIKHVFEFCAEAVGGGVLALDSLELCLHSHSSDPAPWKIGEALSLVKYVPPYFRMSMSMGPIN
jgi:hypothetical protein